MTRYVILLRSNSLINQSLQGIVGCGPTIARALAQYGFGDALLVAITSLDAGQYSSFIAQWRVALRDALSEDSKGHLGRRYKALAAAIDDSFPKTDVILKYLNPLCSDDVTLRRLKNTNQHLDLDEVVQLIQRRFWWSEAETVATLRNNLWAGIVHRELMDKVATFDAHGPDSEVVTVRSLHVFLYLLTYSLQPYAGMLSYDIKGFVRASECKLIVSDGIFNRAVSASFLGMCGFRSSRRSKYTQESTADKTISIIVPADLVAQALPTLTAAFGSKGRRSTGRRAVTLKHV